jgi:sulfatase modifying factor 1
MWKMAGKGMAVYRYRKGLDEGDKAMTNKTETFAGIEMVLIPGNGNISRFYIGKYEVTQKQYESVMGNNPSTFKGKPNNPVEMVHWYNAVDFCNRLSEKAGFRPYYNIDKNNKDPKNIESKDENKWIVTINEVANGFRLPTSAEWEYACRAGTATNYYWGDSGEFSVVNKYAVYYHNSGTKEERHKDYGTHRVGTKLPNAWGLYDISGNVYEWCYEWDQKYIGSQRVLRGGDWRLNTDYLQSGIQSIGAPHVKNDNIGFRLVRNL